VVTTPGIHNILYTGDQIAQIPEGEVNAIRVAVSSPVRIEPHPFLRCGEKVRVTRGSLEGVVGILLRKKSLYRLVLSVEMLAQSVAVEIDAADVEALKPKRAAGEMQGLMSQVSRTVPSSAAEMGHTLLGL